MLGISLQYTSMLKILFLLFQETSNIRYHFSGDFFMQEPKHCEL